jgi:hypothetical protein
LEKEAMAIDPVPRPGYGTQKGRANGHATIGYGESGPSRTSERIPRYIQPQLGPDLIRNALLPKGVNIAGVGKGNFRGIVRNSSQEE